MFLKALFAGSCIYLNKCSVNEFSADIMKMKDISVLAQIAIRKKDERKGKRSTTGVLGFKAKAERTDSQRDVQAEKGISYSQSEVPTPRPLTRKTLPRQCDIYPNLGGL